MVKGKIPILLICLLTAFLGYSQEDVFDNYFKNPLDIPLVMAGTFGELRSNHFHSGLDIKTQRQIGLKVYASASGTISRIKISHYGYGKALYVQHPNGYTTVYAHLKKFSPEIESYIKEKQYQKESFEIEVFPLSGELPVTQGDVIAYSGNTGSSGGPHLHFEIRDKNARPMNPFLFGLHTKDTRKPVISKLIAYPLDENSVINQSSNPLELRLTQLQNGTYTTEKIEAKGRIGIGISTIDQQDLANNKNGIYEINTTLNGEVNFGLQMDKFSFAETRYLNRMIDYSHFMKYKSRVQKLFVEKNNPLSIYRDVVDNGELWIKDSLSYQYNISVKDYVGNESKIIMHITGSSDSIAKPQTLYPTDHYVYADQNYNFSEGKFEVYIPKGALYDDTFLDLKTDGDILTFHHKELPLHKNASISYNVSNYDAKDREKLYLGRLNYKNEVYYSNTKIKDDKLSISTKRMGTYSIGLDKEPPIITPKNIVKGRWMSKYRYLKFEINDSQSGIKGYRATVNGKFILMEYDYKTKSLIHDFNDNIVTDTENNLKLIVTDNVGNSTTFETTFFRKK